MDFKYNFIDNIQEDLLAAGKNVCCRTIIHKQYRHRLNFRTFLKTPLWSKLHREARLKIGYEHKVKHGSIMENVLESDKTKIEPFGQKLKNHNMSRKGGRGIISIARSSTVVALFEDSSIEWNR